jgi:hypothetical protein
MPLKRAGSTVTPADLPSCAPWQTSKNNVRMRWPLKRKAMVLSVTIMLLFSDMVHIVA